MFIRQLTFYLFCGYQPTFILNITVIPPNLAANYDSALFSKLNGTQHPSKPQMNFSKRKKKLLWGKSFRMYLSSNPRLDRSPRLTSEQSIIKAPRDHQSCEQIEV